MKVQREEEINSRRRKLQVNKSNGLLSDGDASVVDHSKDGSNHQKGTRCTVHKEEPH
jgi:hypothetical protein